MSFSYLPALLRSAFLDLAHWLQKRSAARLPLLLTGILFARGRRTVTSWFRAAGIRDDHRQGYVTLCAAGRVANSMALTVQAAVVAHKKLLEEARAQGGKFAPLQGSGGRGKVYLMDSERQISGKEYVGSTKREVGTGRKGYDRMEDADHRAKTTDNKAPKARVIVENLTREEMLGIEGILTDVDIGNLGNSQQPIDLSLPKNLGRLNAADTLLTNWFNRLMGRS